jgi:hypothetical protein
MDYTELAKTTVEFITLGIISGTLKEIGKDIYEKTKQLLQGDELVMLGLLEENPASEDFKKVVSEKLVPRLIENPETASEISKLLQQFELNQIKKNTISQSGDSNIAIQDTTNSKITIQK